MPTGSSPTSLWSPHQRWGLAGALTLCAAAIAGALLLDAGGSHSASALAIFTGAVASGLFFYRSWRSDAAFRRAHEDMQRRYADLYDRAGVSIWREDWSEVGAVIARLREAGVSDIAAWFASRPDEAKALHAQVLITGVNRRSVELMRAPSEKALIGRLCDVLPGSICTFGRWLTAIERGDETYVGESTIARCDGAPFDCLVIATLPADGRLREVIVSVMEITAYKQDQAKLMEARDEIARAQRIATIGALTASIAHEVNSPLAAIASNAAACIRWLARAHPEVEEAKDAAAAVIAEADRAKAIIERTRSYLQHGARTVEDRDLRDLVRSALGIVEREAQAHQINIGVDLSHDLGSLPCEPIQLQQAFVNLMINAIHAMGTSERRQLTIRARRDAGQVRIAVEDTGNGIAPDEARRIFEPFYSTKQGGMGMGLSICRSIVEAHGGSLAVESEPGGGASFIVSLPGAAE